MIVYQPQHFIAQQNEIACGFFGRQGGVSAGIFSSLNCGPGSGDDLAAVNENRARVAQHFGATPENLSTLHQCHSADCVYINTPIIGEKPKGDALVTDTPGLMLGILTADCGPVLLQGRKPYGAPVIGAAHAGWGGALRGVLENTVQQMMKTGAALDTISACVGPCIGPKSYEVSDGFETPFLEHDEQAEHFFKSAAKPGHLMFDLPGYIAFRLTGAGVGRVEISGVDTYAQESRCFSYRRATHRGEVSYGRQISAIMIRN